MRRRREAWPLLVLAAVVYLPLLGSGRGRVVADTKTYLYLDPGELMARAPSMWDPHVGLGTVTHQTIGYLWPMGPWFWTAERLGLPDWVAQRLWLGTVLFGAGAGVWFLLRRTFGWSNLPVAVAMFAYALSPYSLTLSGKHSALVLPFAVLPWLIAFTARAVRRGGWRDPAWCALLTATAGSVNATSLLLVLPGPALWLLFARVESPPTSWRQILGAAGRITLLCVATNAWWAAGLAVQSRYGLDVLRYTETAEAVAAASVGIEVLRGLGYWFFYGGDRLGGWVEAGRDYMRRPLLIAGSFVLPIAATLAGALTRHRLRAYAVALVGTGAVLAVGAHPWDAGAPATRAYRAILGTDSGLALRSTPRAAPLLLLGLAILLAGGVMALTGRRRRWRLLAATAAMTIAALSLPSLWTGGMVPSNLTRAEELPSYWYELADHLDAAGAETRVLALPGIDFASYRWGDTVDPVLPGLMGRGFVARELVPYGSPKSADLLGALDRRLQEGVLEPEAVAPIARLMGAGTVLARNDVAFERYRTARPYLVDPLLRLAPGLAEPAGFGPVGTNDAVPAAPLIDEYHQRDANGVVYPPLDAFPVLDPEPIVRAVPTGGTLLVAGDGGSLVDLAAAGLLTGHELVRYAADLTPDELRAELARGASLVLTDGNRRQGRRWSTVRDVEGFTEAAGEQALVSDPTDNRLPIFPGAGDGSFTVSEASDPAVRATAYGNPISFTPEHRAAGAVDGDPRTAWRVAAFSDPRGERLELSFAAPVTTDRIRLLQPIDGIRNRNITEVELRFDGGDPLAVALGDASREAPGQVVTFAERTLRRVEITILDDDSGHRSRPWYPARFDHLSAVGFAEVDVGDQRGPGRQEVFRLPTDLLSAAGTAAEDRPLAIVLTRRRTDPAEAVRDDEETALARAFELPAPRVLRLSGAARIAPRAGDRLLDAATGTAGPSASGSRRLPGDAGRRASSALDGDLLTAWSPGYGDPFEPDSISVELVDEPGAVGELGLAIVADGRHSVPTSVRVEAESSDGAIEVVAPLPAIDDRVGQTGVDAVVRVDVALPATVRGRRFRISFPDVREVTTLDWYAEAPIRMPLGIAELGLPGATVTRPAAPFDSGCRTDLLELDGQPLPIRVVGPVLDASARAPLRVEACGEAAAVELTAGRHVLRAAKGIDTGIDLDRLVLLTAESAPEWRASAHHPVARPPEVLDVRRPRATSLDVDVTGATPGQPFWLVLHESDSDGWRAGVEGGKAEARSVPVDGYANGWLITPDGTDVTISLRWEPQRLVDAALMASAAAALLCVVLVVPRAGRGRRPEASMGTPCGSPRSAPRARGWVEGALIGTALAAAGFVFVGPLPGLLVGALSAAALVRPPWRLGLVVLAPGALVLGASYVVARQLLQQPEPGSAWPAELSPVHQVALTSVLALVALAVVDWRSGRQNASR